MEFSKVLFPSLLTVYIEYLLSLIVGDSGDVE